MKPAPSLPGAGVFFGAADRQPSTIYRPSQLFLFLGLQLRLGLLLPFRLFLVE
jgi:hypothetical protein